MARHVPLYRALLELLRAISSCTALVPLLLPLSGDAQDEEDEEEEEGQTSVGMLLAKMKTCVDTYTNRLRYEPINQKKKNNELYVRYFTIFGAVYRSIIGENGSFRQDFLTN